MAFNFGKGELGKEIGRKGASSYQSRGIRVLSEEHADWLALLPQMCASGVARLRAWFVVFMHEAESRRHGPPATPRLSSSRVC